MIQRPNNERANELLGLEFPVLDSGFVRLVDYMGTDACIEEAARVSYGSKGRSEAETRKLLRYLRSHRHTSPSEMVELKFHCKLPIFLARQWIRHRTASVNEMSGRYRLLTTEFYRPLSWRKQSTTNKQGSSDERFSIPRENEIQHHCDDALRGSASAYEWLTAADVSRELARTVLPVSTYTEWYWKIDLHNLLHFLGLRFDSHAQQEIQDYARVIAGMVAHSFPLSWEAFVDYEMQACRFSRMEMDALRNLLLGQQALLQGTKREWDEFQKKLERPEPIDVSLPWDKARRIEW